MNFDNFTNVTNTQERDLEMSRVFPSLMRKVYMDDYGTCYHWRRSIRCG